MISIVIPAYNEQEIIGRVISEFYDEIIPKIPESELIVVNDCSTDQTPAVLKELSRMYTKLKVISPQKRGGHGNALRLGFSYACNEFIFYTDGDYQTRAGEFWRFYELRNEYDYITGVRNSRDDGLMRGIVTRALRIALLIVFGRWIRDANCPYKLVRRRVMQDLLAKVEKDVWVPMVMTTVLARKLGYKCKELPISWFSRKSGAPSVSGLWKWFKVGWRCQKEFRILKRTFKMYVKYDSSAQISERTGEGAGGESVGTDGRGQNTISL